MPGSTPFDQLMASLPRGTSTSLGDAFERVVKWFLENDPEYQLLVRRVWLWDQWPGRWGTDTGIDLVVEDHDGKLWAVKAKGYDASASLNYRKLSTLFAAATTEFQIGQQQRQLAMALLVSSAREIGKKAEDHIARSTTVPISMVLRDRLRRSSVEWPASLEGLVGQPEAVIRPPCEPRPH
jgi:predicted helicase